MNEPRVLVKTRKTDDPDYYKNYYETHKEKIIGEMKQLYECPQCKAVLWKGHSARHNKTKKHLQAQSVGPFHLASL